MKTKLTNLLLFAVVFVSFTNVYAQKVKKNSSVDVSADTPGSTMDAKTAKKYYNVDPKKYLKDWNLTVHFGTTTPFTDIRSYDWSRQLKKPSELQWGAGLGLTKMFNSAFGLNVDYTLGKLLGRTVERGGFAEERQYWKQLFPERTEADGPVYFKTNVFHQASVNFYIDWLGLGTAYNKFIKSQITGKPIKSRKFAFYTKLGIGIIRASSQIYNSKDDKPIANNAYLRGYTNKFTEVVFPMAFGMKFKVSKSFDIGLEGNFTFTNSDKLDALQFQSRVDAGGKTVNSLSKINRDAYAYVNVNFSYKFGRIGSQKEHVEWVNPIAFIMANVPKPKEVNLKDTDGDGVLDILDKEPTTEPGLAVNVHGVTLDSDKDGCPDSKDPEPFSSPAFPIVECKNVLPEAPAVTEQVVKGGVPYDDEAVNKKIQKVEDNIWKLTSVYFDVNKYNITSAGSEELKKIGIILSTNPNLKVNVKGNTDVRGSTDFNQKLSENRVNAAIKYLKDHYNIADDRFVKLPMGKSDPLVKDAVNENQHQSNRRVDFSPVR
ncbi:MAG: OmpA family protein [Chitinophagales bacterium]|nr:OmpA family protein [Chitinophagales bacterium]HMV15596.1 OmpA family protein [Chitinophagales bacterium]HMX60050.1 OmpA family protein [Chitinophagales bacterium]HMY24414.1 OmpA family protein [Chitinophagales bacterium]HMZ34229.1 OmpA family protein [Chitinophagales bacterium]